MPKIHREGVIFVGNLMLSTNYLRRKFRK